MQRMERDRLMTLKNVAAMLSLSTRTIRSYVHDPVDPLPAYRVGAKFLFEVSEVKAWIARRRVASRDVDRIVDQILENVGKDETNG